MHYTKSCFLHKEQHWGKKKKTKKNFCSFDTSRCLLLPSSLVFLSRIPGGFKMPHQETILTNEAFGFLQVSFPFP